MSFCDLKLGAIWSPCHTVFTLYAPTAQEVLLRLYPSDTQPCSRVERMERNEGGVYQITLAGDWNGYYYTYSVDGREILDPYARSGGANSKRGLVFDPRLTDPEGWEQDSFTPRPPIIWEVHVRDFSSDPYLELGKDAAKFSGFRCGVKTKGGKSALVDYLKELGVTYVQLLPVLDFGSVDETKDEGYNWGYDPMSYFSPEGSYASDPHDGFARVRELKALVQTLHRAGIGVIFDVVYNHTYRSDDSNLQISAPGEYYRMHDGEFCNGSGCGCETKTEGEPFRRLMLDSIRYLVEEYHADGFRFDLMGLHDVDTMNEVRNMLDNLLPEGRGKQILTYGEPWYWQPPYGVRGADVYHTFELNARVGIFNGKARDGIRGGHYHGMYPGYVQGDVNCLGMVMSGIEGGTVDYHNDFIRVQSPTQQILYSACHDNYTLFDQICGSTPDWYDRVRAQRMAGFLVLSGLGIPFLQGGEEFLYTKNMNGNSYCAGDAVNRLDWARREREDETVQYYRGLIALRKDNTAFNDLSLVQLQYERLHTPWSVAAWRVGNYYYGVNNTDGDVWVSAMGEIDQFADINRAERTGFATSGGGFLLRAHNVYLGRRR